MKEVIHEMYSKEQIDQMVTEIATRINKDYEGKQIHMICILRGSVFFCADLAKKITVPVSMDFMAASSYGNEVKSSGQLMITKDLDDECIDGRHCTDRGRCYRIQETHYLKFVDCLPAQPATFCARSLKIATLLDKPDRRSRCRGRLHWFCRSRQIHRRLWTRLCTEIS